MEALEKFSSHVRNRIIELRKAREQGVRIVGYTPGGYMPEELVHASGAIPVGLIRGGEHEPVMESAVYIPRFIDTFCRSQIGYRMLGEEPLYQMIDLLVAPITDNNIRAIADCWNCYTDVEVFRFGVPHIKDEDAFNYYLEGLHLLRDKLEKLTGAKISDEKFREAIAIYNKIRMLLEQISLLRQSERPPISGKEFARLNHASFYADNSTMVEVLNSLYSELKEREANIPRARILLTGSTLAMGDYKVLDLVEATGGAVVVEEFAEGMRHYWEKVKPDGDLMERLADRYFRNRVPPAWFRPSRERIDFVLKLARDFSVDGIIWYQLMYRDSYDIQSFYFQKILEQETKIPMLKVQSDYDTSEIGPLRTRIETFIEVIEERG
jgi:benzoyl-CoA reductase/2-hydroxyglutaryl-CoA dehydratase subunit BcrC/BadD/HgdB